MIENMGKITAWIIVVAMNGENRNGNIYVGIIVVHFMVAEYFESDRGIAQCVLFQQF